MKFGPIEKKYCGVIDYSSTQSSLDGNSSPEAELERKGHELLTEKFKEICDDRKDYAGAKRKRRTEEEKEPKMKRKLTPANIAIDVAKGCCSRNCIK